MEEKVIRFVPIKKTIDDTKIQISNGSIKNKLRLSYIDSLSKVSATQKIMIGEEVIGYFVIKTDIFTYDKAYENLETEEFEENEQKFSMIVLDLICIDEKYQNRSYGTTVLKYIIKKSKKISEFAGIRFLLVDALYEKVNWYSDNGFIAIQEVDELHPTVKMIIDFRDNDKYNQMVLSP